jgi:Flp pilus assembly protein TadG
MKGFLHFRPSAICVETTGGAGVPPGPPAERERVKMRSYRGRRAHEATERSGRPGRRQRERGAVLVEFALITPLLFILIAGAIDFGFMINRDTLINNATREGAREGTLNPNASAIEAVVRSDLSDLDQSALTVTVTCRKPDASACSNFNADAKSGGVVIVHTQYVHGFFTFTPSAVGMGNSITLSKTVEMRIE